MREKVGKSRNTVCFQWFVAPEGRKVGSLKRRVRSRPQERWKIARRCGAKHISKSKVLKTGGLGPLLEVEMSKKCTPLWREVHFQVKMYKTHHCRITFGSCDVEKSARRCGAKHVSKSKCTKHTRSGPLLEVAMSKKCTPLWREAHFEVKMYKTHHARTTFGGSDVEKSVRRCGAKHTSKSHYITVHYSSSTLHYTKLHYTTLHYTEWHCNTDRQVDS